MLLDLAKILNLSAGVRSAVTKMYELEVWDLLAWLHALT